MSLCGLCSGCGKCSGEQSYRFATNNYSPINYSRANSDYSNANGDYSQ